MCATMQILAALTSFHVLLQMQNADAEVPQDKLDAAKVGNTTLVCTSLK